MSEMDKSLALDAFLDFHISDEGKLLISLTQLDSEIKDVKLEFGELDDMIEALSAEPPLENIKFLFQNYHEYLFEEWFPNANDYQKALIGLRVDCPEIIPDRLLFSDVMVKKSSISNSPKCLSTHLERNRTIIIEMWEWSIINASAKGYLKIVDILLNIPGMPDGNIDKAMLVACGKGHVEIVKLLIKDTRIDPIVYGKGLREAILYNHIQVVKLLLADGRVNISNDRNNCAVVSTIENGKVEILRLLINYPGFSLRQVNSVHPNCMNVLLLNPKSWDTTMM